jgi:hypothetical protein
MPGNIVEKSGCFMQRQNGPVDAYIGTVVVLVIVATVVIVVVVVVVVVTTMTIPMSTHFYSCQ